ncbi:MAG: hypothetical protein FWG91_02715 [Lachnospiraceae bacterium]|nr:hypothetical protein [Lachnospiraceae bacterium]
MEKVYGTFNGIGSFISGIGVGGIIIGQFPMLGEYRWALLLITMLGIFMNVYGINKMKNAKDKQ